MIIFQARSAATLAATMLLVAACGDSGNLPPAPPAEQVQDAAASREVGLPPDFPEDFPLPQDLQITDGSFTAGGAMTRANFLVKGTSDTSVPELAAFFRERLPEAGYTLINETVPQGPAPIIYFQSDSYRDATVQLQGIDGKSRVLINLPLRE